MVETRLLPNCQIQSLAVRVMDRKEMPTDEQITGGGLYAFHQDPHTFIPGDPVATVYQRTWDCCGILMTALYTTLDWTATGSAVYPNNQYNTVIYHREAGGSSGWNLSYQNLSYTGGCAGCWSASLNGNAEYWYQGVLDPSGQLFDNQYHNWMTGYGDGSWYCSYWYQWKNGAPGWSEQAWCG